MIFQVMLLMHSDGVRANLETLELGILLCFFYFVEFWNL